MEVALLSICSHPFRVFPSKSRIGFPDALFARPKRVMEKLAAAIPASRRNFLRVQKLIACNIRVPPCASSDRRNSRRLTAVPFSVSIVYGYMNAGQHLSCVPPDSSVRRDNSILLGASGGNTTRWSSGGNHMHSAGHTIWPEPNSHCVRKDERI